jgi:hypothetical protein
MTCDVEMQAGEAMRGGKPSELQHSHSAAVVILLVGSQNPVALRLVGRMENE